MPSASFGQRVQLFFSLLWIGCFRCWQRVRCRNVSTEIKDHYEILCLGLSGSGKTGILSALVGESIENIPPTTGFNTKNLILQDISINLKEIGGGDSVRRFWSKYFNGINALIFVINGSSDEETITKSCQELRQVLNSHPTMNDVPCIVFFTHKDLPEIKSMDELINLLKKAGLGNRIKKQWLNHICSIYEPETVKEGIDSLLSLLNAKKQKTVSTDDSFLTD